MSTFTESTIEEATLDWLKEPSYIYILASLRDTLPPIITRGEVRVSLADSGTD